MGVSLKGIGENIKGRAINAALGAVNKSISNKLNSLLGDKLGGKQKGSPLAKLYKDKNYEDLVFPLDLDDEHFMIIKVMERVRDNAFSKGTLNVVRNVVLPIPSNLTSAYTPQYQNENLGAFGAATAGDLNSSDVSAGLAAAADMIRQGAGGAADAVKNKDTDAALSLGAAAGPALAAGAAAKVGGVLAGGLVAGGTSGGVIAGASKRLGLAVNPHQAVVFQGLDFRSHSFTYKFIAKSQKESIALDKIVNGLKYHMLPSYTAGKFGFKYPDEFEIEFSELHRPWLYEIGTCVLKNLSINYNGEGTPLFFEQTGAPVSVEFTMEFQETKLQTRDNFDKGSLRK
jgi:hypothetical protein